MYIKLLIFAFCASLVASGEIADNLRQEYEDMMNNAAQLFANMSYFLTAMAQQYGVRINRGMQELEKQRLDLTNGLQVLATDSIFYDSRLMDCFVAGQTRISTIIGETEYILFDLWQDQNTYRSEVVIDIQNIGDALDAFVIRTQEAIGLCDGVNSDDIDSCFSGLYPEINNANTNILDQINEQSLFSIQYYIRYDEILNGYNSDTEIYLNTGYEDARRELTNCIEST